MKENNNYTDYQVWVDIKGYEGLYQTTVHGEIKSLYTTHGRVKILKHYLQSNGYFAVTLWKNGIKKTALIHRIIAENFIQNTNPNSIQVNHKNGNKKDNRIENLEWVTQSENTIHAISIGLIPKRRIRTTVA